MKAVWNGEIIAQSDKTVVIENNHYFPPESVNKNTIVKSDTSSHCPWKGDASYYTLKVDGEENKDAAWYYPNPSHAAKDIKDHVAFWKGVKIEP
ncbi:DUF427 domain-containing protein [Gangjinia marincola]|uniref:DUF427 domain-containing protein n=1 Tax=Gangjinia marincola TaxID=578463 RepID=A0ABN1MDZ9_9FLAO